jgi:hypothetical protein
MPIFVILSLVLALFAAPVPASATVCGMKMPSMDAMHCGGCCATTKCCGRAQQDPQQPLAAGVADAPLLLTAAPVLPVLVRELPLGCSIPTRAVDAASAAAPPRLTLFCSFLI